MKNCSKCKQESSNYPKDKKAKDGLSSMCRPCHNLASKAWRDKQPSDYWRNSELKMRSRWKSAQRQAAKRNVTWDLNLEDFKELNSDPCFYCENELHAASIMGSGLDRVNNDLGYEYDNCVPCCKVCNKIKNNFLTVDETLVAISAIKNLRKGATHG